MKSTRTVAGLALVLPLALGLAACTPASDESPAPSSPASMPPSEALPGPEDGGNDGEDAHELVPEPDESGRGAIEDAATATFEAYADKDQSYQAWFDGLRPHLHPTAVPAYETVQPQSIPALDVEGVEALSGWTEAYASVEISTSAGPYLVELQRATTDEPWLATRITPDTNE